MSPSRPIPRRLALLRLLRRLLDRSRLHFLRHGSHLRPLRLRHHRNRELLRLKVEGIDLDMVNSTHYLKYLASQITDLLPATSSTSLLQALRPEVSCRD